MGVNENLHKDDIVMISISMQVLILQPANMLVYGANSLLKDDMMLKSNGH